MTSIIEQLKNYSEKIKIEDRFTYNFDSNSTIFSDQEKYELTHEQNNFKRNIILKELMKTKTKGSFTQTELNFWIVNDWGRIQTFKKNEKNIEKISKFSKQLSEFKLTQDTFGTISSLSKISSFVDPDNYVIYDSRVIYSINWLILTSTTTDLKFFPMPTGRNKKLIDFDLKTIIHLIHLDKYKSNETLFYDHRFAYFQFCKLLKLLSKAVFDDHNVKPYYLEMLLFTIADNEINQEIIQRTSIGIKNLSSI